MTIGTTGTNPSTASVRCSNGTANVAMAIRCWAYYRRYGSGLKWTMSEHAVLNANYLRHAIHREAKIAMDHLFVDGADRCCKTRIHPFHAACEGCVGYLGDGCRQGLLDRGYGTNRVFPLVVPECMMIEPTETESKDTLDAFAEHFAQGFENGSRSAP